MLTILASEKKRLFKQQTDRLLFDLSTVRTQQARCYTLKALLLDIS